MNNNTMSSTIFVCLKFAIFNKALRIIAKSISIFYEYHLNIIEYRTLKNKRTVETKSKKIAAMTKGLLTMYTGEIDSKRIVFFPSMKQLDVFLIKKNCKL